MELAHSDDIYRVVAVFVIYLAINEQITDRSVGEAAQLQRDINPAEMSVRV